ncbi:hypothetical protein ACFQU9_43065 [Actinomadura namibiensis]
MTVRTGFHTNDRVLPAHDRFVMRPGSLVVQDRRSPVASDTTSTRPVCPR